MSDDTVHALTVFGKTRRCQGFAIFLIIHAIKSMCVLDTWESPARHFKYPHPVHFFLQCTQSAAYHFYLLCGFVQLNRGCDDRKSLCHHPFSNLLKSTLPIGSPIAFQLVMNQTTNNQFKNYCLVNSCISTWSFVPSHPYIR